MSDKRLKPLRKIGKRIPPVRAYVKWRRLTQINQTQTVDISNLHQSIKQLEARNDEWAAEVRKLRHQDETMYIIWPALPQDILDADWRKPPHLKKTPKHQPPYTFNWVVPPMGQVSGGNVDIFRSIAHLESKGHTCRVYFYDARNVPTFEQVKQTMKEYPSINSELFYNSEIMEPCDAIFATNWFTAYPVFNFKETSKKFYYIQDFEPFFEPAGTYSTLAANTYHFGFHGLTLGDWLAEKLTSEYGMTCDPFDLGVDSKDYKLINFEPRKKVLFYARPVSPRRGFEIGILALEQFHKQHPEYEINLIGWDMSRYDIPFPYVNKGILSSQKLNELYNMCAAGLVLSFTNMSLLPLEMLACGCLPVVNDAPHTRLVKYSKQIQYAIPSPQALAEALYEAVRTTQNRAFIKEIAKKAEQYQWEDANNNLEKIIIRELT